MALLDRLSSLAFVGNKYRKNTALNSTPGSTGEQWIAVAEENIEENGR